MPKSLRLKTPMYQAVVFVEERALDCHISPIVLLCRQRDKKMKTKKKGMLIFSIVKTEIATISRLEIICGFLQKVLIID